MTTDRSRIDAYLAALSPDRRAALEALRATMRRLLPTAEECVSYGLPAFRVDGKIAGGFAATGAGCSYYPFSGSTLDGMAADLAGWSRTKSALHFDPAKGLPRALVKKLVQARLAEIRGAAGATPVRRRTGAGGERPARVGSARTARGPRRLPRSPRR